MAEALPSDNILATVKARQRTLRLKRCGSPATATVTTVTTNTTNAQSSGHPSTTPSTSSAGAKRSTPYGWTLEEKLFFFEALRLFGKNFPEVSRHIRRRVRRFSLTFKSREQCRLFYYRTWQYVKKHLRIVEEVPNLTMELYGLINYSVIYSRVKKKLNTRLGEKLIELVQTGITTLRFRGKRLVLRTPCCPSLKRLNGIEDPKQEYRVPDTLQVELIPRTSASFQRVQACAQNPSVRFLVSANRQLGEILSHLEGKWRSSSARMRQELRLPVEDTPRLSVRLPEDTSLEEAVSVATVARCRYQDISLNAYLDRLHRSTNNSNAVGAVLPQTASAPPPPPEDDPVRLELMEIGRLVLKGVDVEAATRVKILALYLALGCPAKIQLEYDYMSPSEMECSRNPFSNAMRRLIHLCRSQQTTFKTMDEQMSKIKDEKDGLTSQLERVKRAPCSNCGISPEAGSSGAGSTGSAGDKGNNATGSGTFRRPRAVYPKPTPSEQAARDKALRQLSAVTGPRLTGVNGRSSSIVIQRELQIDDQTEPGLKPVCGVPATTTGAAEAAVLRDRARRQQPLIMHRNDRNQFEAASRMVAQLQRLQHQQMQTQQKELQKQEELQQQQKEQERQQNSDLPGFAQQADNRMDVTCEGSSSSTGTNIIDRAFRMAMASDNSVSHDSLESLITKIGQSTPRHFAESGNEKTVCYPPPPTPPPAHLGDCLSVPSPAVAVGNDSNLSALGSLLESPVKGSHHHHHDIGDSQDSMVGRAVDAMMNENSVDYCRKFADLAERLVSTDS